VDDKHRRRFPRVSADSWPGKYVVEDDPSSGWHECSLIDLSLLGMGLELLGPSSPELIGRRILVHVDVGEGKSIALRLAGVVRNLHPGPSGSTRAGIEFTDLSEGERSVLTMMEHLKIRW